MRIRQLSPDEMTKEQREVYDANMMSKRRRVPLPFYAWMLSPHMAKHIQPLSEYLRFQNLLGDRLTEVAVLVTARYWKAHYEWHGHKQHALDAGLDPAIIASIRVGTTPAFQDEEAKLVYEVTKSLLENQSVPTPIYEAAITKLGEQRLVELVGVIGYFCFVSMTLNMFDLGLPPGVKSDLD